MPTIALLGTMDTKGVEHGFVAECIRARGHRAFVIDVGSGGPPQLAPDVSREEVAALAGVDLAAIV
ncbi:MAG TPA: Tm-1-like ATP-binding domain-containing protein, partial [Chthoniobacteraceae bacterium]|nr:Tm-1-like ATP-binding domain-containing protein [Chthoniobacteraceae bacterium]